MKMFSISIQDVFEMRYAQMPDEPPESTMTDSCMSSSDNEGLSETDDGEQEREKRIQLLQEQVRH